MAATPVVDVDDPRLSSFRILSDAALIRERGLFVAEGRLIVERVLGDGRLRVEALLVNKASLTALESTPVGVPDETPVFVCDNTVIEQLTGFDFHRGCVALVRRPRALSLDEVLADATLVVVLEGVTNADNVGSVFRSAAAFGVGAVLLSPTCCDPLYRKSIRTSMGAALQVPSTRLDPWPSGLTQLEAAGFATIALSPRAPAIDLDDFVGRQLPPRLALLIGTEGPGLSHDAQAMAHVRVRIPMNPGVDSLNLGVAAGIVLSRLSASHGVVR